MICSELPVVSRVKIGGDEQPKNLATLCQMGYEVCFIESEVDHATGDGVEPYFYYEAQRGANIIRATTPAALLQLAKESG